MCEIFQFRPRLQKLPYSEMSIFRLRIMQGSTPEKKA